MLQTALHFSHELLQAVVKPGDHVIDATMGNGHDTLFLAQLVGAAGTVYAFDIQAQALENTRQRLTAAAAASQTKLFLAGHETIGEKISPTTPITGAIFNLGYLPQSDKSVITLPATTKQAIEAILARLVSKGRLVIVCYYGHPGGESEKEQILAYCQALPQQTYSVLAYQFINQKNNPPILLCIEKK